MDIILDGILQVEIQRANEPLGKVISLIRKKLWKSQRGTPAHYPKGQRSEADNTKMLAMMGRHYGYS